VVSAVVIVATLSVVPGTADAHFLGYDSVDDCEIRWEDDTVFDTERQAAQNAWEALKGDNCVDLAPDAWDTIADLEWQDSYRPDAPWAGRYQTGPGADEIILNSSHLSGYSQCQRKMVAIHELGHAHGLDHGPAGNVMVAGVTSRCTLGTHDIADYESLWGSRNPPPRPTSTPSTHTP
jgi:hypothetical protein